MIVNMYVDHMMAHSPMSAEDVWFATNTHPREYKEAARKVGMTPKEYTEFRESLLAGKVIYLRLPRHVDAMAGIRRGNVYAVHNAIMTTPQYGWKIKLNDGNIVYIPQTCGNISFVHQQIAYHQSAAHVPHIRYVAPPPIVQVVVAPPAPQVTPAAVAPVTVTPVAKTNYNGLFAIIPILGGIVYQITKPGTPTNVPHCSQGSNSMGVCNK